jgi:hypothetical protein
MSSFVEVFEDNEENCVLNNQCKEQICGKSVDSKEDESSFSVIMANTIVHPESSTKNIAVLSALKTVTSKSFLGNDSINSYDDSFNLFSGTSKSCAYLENLF